MRLWIHRKWPHLAVATMIIALLLWLFWDSLPSIWLNVIAPAGELIVSILVAVGTLGLAATGYIALRRDVYWREKMIEPQLDVRIVVDDDGDPILVIRNMGERTITGILFMFVEPQIKGSDQIPSSIIGNTEMGGVTKEQYSEFLFARLNLHLSPNEKGSRYQYPFRTHLGRLCGEQNIYHFVRIEVYYGLVGLRGSMYKLLKRYHMQPPSERVPNWTAGAYEIDGEFREPRALSAEEIYRNRNYRKLSRSNDVEILSSKN